MCVCVFMYVCPYLYCVVNLVLTHIFPPSSTNFLLATATPFLTLIIKQFEDLLVLILLGAAFVSFGLALLEDEEDRLTAFVEPAVILIILIANAAVGVIQESNAEASIEALKKSEARHATVLRNGGQVQHVNASELVPGDIIVVENGDKVPADARVLRIETATLQIDEAILTGESVAAQKHHNAISDPEAVNADKRNMLFSGTLCVRGKCLAVVTTIGAKTAFGEIAEGLNDKDDDEKTPLQEKLDEFGEQLSKVILVICIVVWLINIGHFTDPEHGSAVKGAIYYFKIAVALAVAAIPEGLPAVVTTCLALGTMKMAQKNAIVRSLPSVETLGCTSVICSDKTGTLTTNMMSVQEVVAVGKVTGKTIELRSVALDGDSFAPYGKVSDVASKDELVIPAVEDESLSQISKICVLCNDSDLSYAINDDGEGVYTKTGTPTEAALKVAAEKLSVPDRAYAEKTLSSKDPHTRVVAASKYWKDRYERQMLVEFSRSRKSMSVIVKEDDSKDEFLFCKGAPESVLSRCTHVRVGPNEYVEITKEMTDDITAKYEELASRGLRCLALAEIHNPDLEDADFTNLDTFHEIESGMAFVGLTSMLDPPRHNVHQSIQKCRSAGIRVIVITGDNQTTAESICKRIGVFAEGDNIREMSFTGAEFNKMSERKKDEVLRTARLFSRVEPRHKSKIVQILKKQGEVTAMTGDGVNDAPALKAAHIGIAMGSGTDVAREASDMVLQDDNFATIVMAVEEGRAIYANTKQFIRYLISSNIGEVACIFFTAAIGMPEALIPVQLLWVNLVTDGLPATALGFNPPDSDIMQKPPRDRSEGIINGWMFFRYMAIGIYVGIGTVFGFIWWFLMYENGPQITYEQLTNFHSCSTDPTLYPTGFDCDIFHDARPSTISLSILVTIEMFNALNALSENQSLLRVPPWTNIWVVLAVMLSFALHFMIVYVPFFSGIFHVAPLSTAEWTAVVMFSAPVFLLDEILKFISRNVAGMYMSCFIFYLFVCSLVFLFFLFCFVSLALFMFSSFAVSL